MERLVLQCIDDMQAIAASGKYTLDAQVRAYDLLEGIIELYDDRPLPEELKEAASRFGIVYASMASVLDSSFDCAALAEEAAQRLKPLEEASNEFRFQAAAAASLHEFAKEVFEVWQNSGVFARRRALRELRERAYADDTNRVLLDEFKRLQIQLQMSMAGAAGQMPSEDMQRFQQLASLLYMNSDVQAYLMAEMQMQKTLADVFKILTEAAGVKFDLPENA